MSGKRKAKKPFMKLVLAIAFIQITIFTIWQMVVFTMTGNEAATLIQWFFTLWGIEVGLLMLKKLIEANPRKSKKTDSENLNEEFTDYTNEEIGE